MAITDGGSAINIKQDIVENGDSYDFYQAVKLLNKLAAVPSGSGVAQANLRIQPELNLEYPQADIAEISYDETAGQYRITTTFFGLYGVSSPLPGFYTEELLDDEWDESSSRKEFLDVIHNHIYPLLYQAWLKYKFAHNVVEIEDHKYLEVIYSLIGLGEVYRDESEPYGYLLKYSGLLSQRIKSLLGLKTILQDRLGDIGLDIKPCVERKVPIVKQQRCLLGLQNTTLGADACIGKQVVDRSGKFDIEIGPLNAQEFSRLSQARDTVDSIKTILKIYLVQPLDYSISLLLEPGAIKPGKLGERESSILGINCWLSSRQNEGIERIELVDARA